jgi:hypothetical protein
MQEVTLGARGGMVKMNEMLPRGGVLAGARGRGRGQKKATIR